MNRSIIAISSSVFFVFLAAILVLVPAPYVTWRPGKPVDVLGNTDAGPIIEIKDAPTYDTSGKLLLTVVSTSTASAHVSLPEAMLVYFQGGSYAMPRELIYPAGSSQKEISEAAVASMDTSRENAVVAALRAAGIPVVERPMVSDVIMTGPAGGKLEPGDLILEVNGHPVETAQDVSRAVNATVIGRGVTFLVDRDGTEQRITVTAAASSQDSSRPVVGIGLGTGYEYAPGIAFGLGDDIVGPSAGLVFALGIYDHLTDGFLVGNATVAATGEIDPSGGVTAIGGVREKIVGAEKAGASIFLLPSDNCASVGDLQTKVRLVPVATLRDAVAALQFIAEGNEAEVPSCD